ncbi:hypothetical protein ANN_07946 [Periplaneta americana]|uniref:Uncharacterized protein n=1 Tax=Periplaneta americana TaxID=6978 RepID=A0ABQ8T1F1_PERAM|nr:hypothetical protein ANN_07946 [Periplaneta americana]
MEERYLNDTIWNNKYLQLETKTRIYELFRAKVVSSPSKETLRGHSDSSFRDEGYIQHLDRRFPDRWIGRGGPVAWPSRSPDLNPLDFYLWGHLKSLVYSSPVPDLESLRNRIVACSEDIRNTPGVWDRVRRAMRHRCEVCIQAGGGHFEHLL